MAKATVYGVGHSNLTYPKFLANLQRNGIEHVVDIRKLTGSTKFPWTNEDRLGPALRKAGIEYTIVPDLKGRRPVQPDVDYHLVNAWANHSFENYAAYTQTPAFAHGLALLERFAAQKPTVMMCKEGWYIDCHRRLIKDWLIAQGHPVFDITASGKAEPMRLNPIAKVHAGRVTYPGHGYIPKSLQGTPNQRPLPHA